MTADRAKVTRLLKTARGQMDGILKMIEDNRYCIDISNQIMACQAILSRVNKEVLNAHLANCVLNSTEVESKEKLEEIAKILDQLL